MSDYRYIIVISVSEEMRVIISQVRKLQRWPPGLFHNHLINNNLFPYRVCIHFYSSEKKSKEKFRIT